MALTFVAGRDTFSLSETEVQTYPNALLASLVASVGSSNAPVTLTIDALPNGPFSNFSSAADVTVAIYKRQPLAVDVLNSMLGKCKEVQVWDKIATLLDFLNIPLPVEEALVNLMPPRSTCKGDFKLLGACGLHSYVLARRASHQIMSAGPAVSSTSCHGMSEFSLYYVTLKEGDSLDDVCVYAVGGDCLNGLDVKKLDPNRANFNRGAEANVVLLSSGGCLADSILWTTQLLDSPYVYGCPVSNVNDALGKRLAAMLQAAVGGVSVNGQHAALHVSCVQLVLHTFGEFANPFWLLRW